MNRDKHIMFLKFQLFFLAILFFTYYILKIIPPKPGVGIQNGHINDRTRYSNRAAICTTFLTHTAWVSLLDLLLKSCIPFLSSQ